MEMEEYHEDEEFKKKQKEELQKLIDDVIKDAKNVVEDYKNNPSEMSGSVIGVHENSPYLDVDENDKPLYKGNRWKKVLKGSVDDAKSFISKKNNKKA